MWFVRGCVQKGIWHPACKVACHEWRLLKQNYEKNGDCPEWRLLKQKTHKTSKNGTQLALA